MTVESIITYMEQGAFVVGLVVLSVVFSILVLAAPLAVFGCIDTTNHHNDPHLHVFISWIFWAIFLTSMLLLSVGYIATEAGLV